MRPAHSARRPTGHVSRELLRRYAAGEVALADDAVWAVEAHLEACAACRAQLGSAVRAGDGEVRALLDRVRGSLDDRRDRVAPVAARRPWAVRRSARWAPPVLLPWLATTVLLVAVAVVLDDAGRVAGVPLLLVIAPVAPLGGVVAAWSPRLDPAFELTAGAPRAGLELVLRRAAAALVVVIPVLAAGGLVVGVSPALWLLPCLAFTCGALALGAVVGSERACAGLGLLWAAGVVAPTVATRQPPVALTAASMPVWAIVLAVAVTALALRRRTLGTLPGRW